MTAQGTFQDRPFVRRKCSVAIGANLYVTRSRTARRLLESARFGKRRANSNRYAAQRLPSSPINALRADVAHGKRGSITHPHIADSHVSLCQVKAKVFLGRSRERPKQ